MDRKELRAAFEAQKPYLSAWGKFVTDHITSRLQTELPGKQLRDFLKVWPEPRVKQASSFLDKAGRAGKAYKQPLEEITDKVGVRFIVLLLHEIRIVERIVASAGEWTAEKARDFEEEKARLPYYFDYQSVHYVVRSAGERLVESVMVPAGTACEVQIRTLLQHAYSELAHDATYKPHTAAGHSVNRQVAKSMALIETTDEIFETVRRTLDQATDEISRALLILSEFYRSRVLENLEADRRLSEGLLDCYRDFLPTLTQESLASLFEARPFLFETIRGRATVSELYAQPVIMAVYFFVFHEPDATWQRWPLDVTLLNDVYADLGISTADRF